MTRTRIKSFDGWLLRVDVGELEKDGRKIRLQDQPLQVLDELLSRPGELVTREELIARLWPKGVVDFDTGINSAVRKLRVALEDVGDTPRYIETIPRKGYRFIGTLDGPVPEATPPHESASPIAGSPAVGLSPASEAAAPASQSLLQPLSVSPAPRLRRIHLYLAAGLAAVVVAGGSIFLLRRESVSPSTQSAVHSTDRPLDARTLAVLPLRTAAADEAGLLLAQSVTDLIRNRLATFRNLVVIASNSTAGLTSSRDGLRATGERLHARYLVTGAVERAGEQLHLEVQLIDAGSGEQLWQTEFDRPLADVLQVREEIFQHVASVLDASVDPVGSNAPAPAAISLEAYQLYLRGQQLMANETKEDVDKAIEKFRRATVLDPGFARAYVGLGQAQWLAYNYGGPAAPDLRLAAQNSIARALELNPALGEAWIERARWSRDVQEAESQYRKGLEFAPNYGRGYSYFADFLFVQNRLGEAIDTIARARAIDPLTPDLYLNQAFMEIVARSDIEAHDRLVLQALEINPNYQPALRQLAESRWEYNGEFADAARLIERSLDLDPHFEDSRTLATHVYLDLGEAQSAIGVRGEGQMEPALEILQFQRDRRRVAELVRDLPSSALWFGGAFAIEAEALRDDAITRGDYAPALAKLEAAYATRPSGRPLMWSRYQALVYAHVLVLAGQTERGRKLASSTLVMLDSQSVGRTQGWLARERAVGYMVLGEKERALDELAAAVVAKRFYRWWYTFELDPLFEPLHRDTRFMQLKEQVKKHCDEQRVLLEQMRTKGEVPRQRS